MSHHDHHDEADDTPTTFGALAELDGPTGLVKAARVIRDAGYKRWDAHSPFPVHGLDPSMGIKSTILPWIVLGAGLSGLGLALLMQWWMNAIDYPFVISGKPIFSLPANIPVIFETTVLLSGLTAFFGVLVLNFLPEHYNPLFRVEKFKRATSDGFFIAIEASDEKWDERATVELLKKAGAKSVELVQGEPKRAFALPKVITYVGLVAVCASWIPLALVANARYTKSRDPKVHLVYDMDAQPKVKAQAASKVFANGQGWRPPVAGTVAQGELREDDHFERGVFAGNWATELPPQVALNDTTMARGQERFGIYCAPCHGLAGGGDGMVARRAAELAEGTWVPPTSIHAAHVRAQPPGQIFNTITNGVRNMPSYAAQIPPADRWAIILYIQALQRSQYAQLTDVPAELQPTLR